MLDEDAIAGAATRDKGFRLFAVKKGADALLDVARRVYSDTRRDIMESQSAELSFDNTRSLIPSGPPNQRSVYRGALRTAEHELPECELHTTRAGYRFKVQRSFEEGALARHFINQDRQKKQ